MSEIKLNPQMLQLHKAFKKAADSTGVSFDFLVKTAARESGFQASAKAKSSSAAGLFQFIEQTWLGITSRHGAKHGLGSEAAQITRNENGKYAVKNKAVMNRILGYRHDPSISSAMAAELTAENKSGLRSALGREPEDADLYTAHFLGLGSAIKLLRSASAAPDMNASKLFPGAAAANPAIFKKADGSARNVSELVAELASRHDRDDADQLHTGTPDTQSDFQTSGQIAKGAQIAGHFSNSSLLKLSPVLVQLLSELSVPGVVTDKDKT